MADLRCAVQYVRDTLRKKVVAIAGKVTTTTHAWLHAGIGPRAYPHILGMYQQRASYMALTSALCVYTRLDTARHGIRCASYMALFFLSLCMCVLYAQGYMGLVTPMPMFMCVCYTGHSKGGNVVLLYAAQYDDVPLVVNIAGRYHMQQGVKVRDTH